MSVFLAIIGYTTLGAASLLDKFILSKRVSHPLTYVFYISIIFLLLFFLLPFGIYFPSDVYTWSAVAASGFFFFMGLWLMFIGVQKSEVSHVGPLMGAAISLSTVILGRIFLGETLPVEKTAAIGLLIAGSLIISFEKSRRHHGWHAGMLFGILAGLAFAGSHVASKFAYDELGFYSGLILTRAVLGLCGLFLLAAPVVRAEVFSRQTGSRPRKKRGIVFINLALGTLGVLLIQYAISLGSVSLVNAFEGLKYAVLIVLVAILSKFFPKVLKEEYSRGEMLQEILAVLLIAGGLVMLI